MSVRHPLRTTGLVAAALSAVAVGAALPAQADPGNGNGNGNGSTEGHNPPGNNGTVFIHDVAGDHHPHNVPHVSCVFYADFFGFDKDQQVTVTFAGQAPTGKATKLGGTWGPGVISTTDAGGAGNDFDHELKFTADNLGVSALGTPAKQGYHIRMTVLTGQGGGRKTKVFWLGPCTSAQSAAVAHGAAAQNNSTQNTSSAAATSSATQGGSTWTTTMGPAENAAAAVLGESLTAPATAGAGASAPAATSAASTRVLGERITRSNAAQVLGARLSRATSLPFTGLAGVLTMSLLGMLLTAGGVIATVAARRRRQRA